MVGPAAEDEKAPGEGFLVLWVGGVGGWETEVQAGLRRGGVRVEEVGLDALLQRALQRAPDLVVLAGAAGGAPSSAVNQLAVGEPASSVPVVAIGPSKDASEKPKSRYGLVARLDRDASPDALSEQLVGLLRGLSRRPSRTRVRVSLEDVPSVARKFAVAHRSGILTAADGGAIAIDPQGVLAPEPGLLVASLTGTLEVELTLHERPPGRVTVLRDEPRDDDTAPGVEGARVLVIDEDASRGQKLAARIERAGAETRVAGVSREAIRDGRSLDPTLVIVAAPALVEPDCSPLWEESRLGAASLLVLDGDVLARAGNAAILSVIAGICRTELSLRRRLRHEEAVAARLETLGTARWLKLLGKCEHDVSLRVFAAAGRGRVDFSGGKAQGASFHPADGRDSIQGRVAIEALLGLHAGRVLAGPPAALVRLEGVRHSRKPSVVGRVVPTPSSGVRRKQGLVVTEVVVQRTDASSPPRAPVAVRKPTRKRKKSEPSTQAESSSRQTLPAKGNRSVESSEGPSQSRKTLPDKIAAKKQEERVSLLDAADDEIPTATYDAEVVSQLQAALRRPATADAETGGDDRESKPTRGAPRSAEKTAPKRDEAPREKKRDKRREREAGAKSARAEGAGVDSIADLPPPKRRVKAGEEPIEAPNAVASPAPKSSSSLWFVAGAALAVAVGGWAVWRMGADERAATVASAPTGPAVDRAEPPVDPREGRPTEVEPVGAIEPEATAPVIEPEATEPAVLEPAVIEPEATEPAVIEPAVIEPEPEVVAPVAPSPAGTSVSDLLTQSSDAARERSWGRSAELARQALSLDATSSPAAYRLAVAQFRLREYDDATRWAERAIELDPEDPLPLSLLGDIHMRLGRFPSAAREYQRAVEVQDDFAPALRQLERLRERGVTP